MSLDAFLSNPKAKALLGIPTAKPATKQEALPSDGPVLTIAQAQKQFGKASEQKQGKQPAKKS